MLHAFPRVAWKTRKIVHHSHRCAAATRSHWRTNQCRSGLRRHHGGRRSVGPQSHWPVHILSAGKPCGQHTARFFVYKSYIHDVPPRQPALQPEPPSSQAATPYHRTGDMGGWLDRAVVIGGHGFCDLGDAPATRKALTAKPSSQSGHATHRATHPPRACGHDAERTRVC